MRLITYNWNKVERAVQDIAMGMYKDNWRFPDYIVGVTRGGLVPAVMLSHMTSIINAHIMCSTWRRRFRRKYRKQLLDVRRCIWVW